MVVYEARWEICKERAITLQGMRQNNRIESILWFLVFGMVDLHLVAMIQIQVIISVAMVIELRLLILYINSIIVQYYISLSSVLCVSVYRLMIQIDMKPNQTNKKEDCIITYLCHESMNNQVSFISIAIGQVCQEIYR